MRLAAKLDGYRRRALYEWKQARHRAAVRNREVAFQSWLDSLCAKPPEVLVGANFAAYGGVRQHVQAIQRYSALDVQLAPPESVLQKIGPHHLSYEFRQRFLDFPAGGIKVVHSHVFPWFIEWCRHRQQDGVRWVHTYHLNYYPEHGRNGLEPWQQNINDALINVARHADVCLSVSKWQVMELRRELGIESHYLPNGVDVALCDAADGERFSREYKLEQFVLYVGRNQPVKDPGAFVRLSKRLPELQFVMVGGGLSEDDLLSALQWELPPNLRVLGPLPHTKVLDAIAACSVLVVTSKREGLPTLVLEAMAQGKTVVVPAEAGCLEAINHGECGYVYAPGDMDDLNEKTIEALADDSPGQRGRDRARKLYDWRVIGLKLDQIYAGEKP